jgi:hypothetical protein
MIYVNAMPPRICDDLRIFLNVMQQDENGRETRCGTKGKSHF